MKYDITINGTIGWETTSDYISYQLQKMKGKRVDVRICSLGGYVTDGIDIYQLLRDHGDVHCHFVGMSASAATFLAMGAKSVDMVKNSLILIHNASIGQFTWGSYNKEQLDELIKSLGKDREDLATIDSLIASVYADRCGKSIEEVMPKIRAQETVPGGIKIIGEIVSLNRMEKAADTDKSALETITDKYGFPARAIVSMADVIDALYTHGDKSVITDEIKSELDKYYEQYGAKSNS